MINVVSGIYKTGDGLFPTYHLGILAGSSGRIHWSVADIQRVSCLAVGRVRRHLVEPVDGAGRVGRLLAAHAGVVGARPHAVLRLHSFVVGGGHWSSHLLPGRSLVARLELARVARGMAGTCVQRVRANALVHFIDLIYAPVRACWRNHGLARLDHLRHDLTDRVHLRHALLCPAADVVAGVVQALGGDDRCIVRVERARWRVGVGHVDTAEVADVGEFLGEAATDRL